MAAERVPLTTVQDLVTGVDVLPVHDRQPLVWGSIIGGFLIGLTTWALLNLLGVALGLTAFNAGQAAAQGTAPASETGMNSVIWAGIVSILSYLIGGFAAARIAGVFGRDRGAGNGTMVFLLSVPFAMVMTALGVSGMLGGLGGIVGGAAEVANQQLPNIQGQVQGTITPTNATVAVEAARNAAWGALIAMLLGLSASALGGMMGARDLHREVRTVDVR